MGAAGEYSGIASIAADCFNLDNLFFFDLIGEVDFLSRFLVAVEVGEYFLCSCGCIDHCPLYARSYVFLPSFHPLLFSVCR